MEYLKYQMHVTKRRATVPNHPGVDIPKGTLRAIIKESGCSVEEFVRLR